MKMYATGWKKDGNTYAVQVSNIKHGEKREVKSIFKDWKESSVGWNVKNGDLIIVFNKEFSDQKDWLTWAKKCPITLTEIKVRSGKEEKIQLSGKEKKKRAKNEFCNTQKEEGSGKARSSRRNSRTRKSASTTK